MCVVSVIFLLCGFVLFVKPLSKDNFKPLGIDNKAILNLNVDLLYFYLYVIMLNLHYYGLYVIKIDIYKQIIYSL